MSASLSTLIMPKRPPILSTAKNFAQQYINRMQPVNVAEYHNGFKVATERKAGNCATVGLFTRSGSRFETINTNGTSHLMQKAMWKGTATRNAQQIQEAIAQLGGNIQINQGREIQSVKITVLKQDVPAAIELLADVAIACNLDEKAVTEAQADCIETLKDWEDDQLAQLFGGLHMACYDTTDGAPGGGLGLGVYGSGENIKGGLKEEDCQAFYTNCFLDPKNMNLVISGCEDEDAVHTQVEQLFGSLVHQGIDITPQKRYVGGDVRRFAFPMEPYSNWSQLGFEICPADSQDSVPLQLCLEMYGSYDRFQHDLSQSFAIRNMYETYETMTQYGGIGMPHFVRPFMHQYSDTGLMGLYWCTPNNVHMNWGNYELHQRLGMEFQMYCMRLSDYQVDVGKNKLKSQLLLGMDGTSKSVDTLAQQLQYSKRWIPLEEQYARIDNLNTAIVSDVINHYYYDREPCASHMGFHRMDMPALAFIRGYAMKSPWF